MSTTRRGPCPQCERGPKDTALAITTDERGTVSYCHRCGYIETEPLRRPSARLLHPRPVSQSLDWSERAQAIWERSKPLAGSLGARYLESRRCRLPPADGHLRYLAPTDRHPPSLVGLVTDAVTAKPISLHFTRLATDGRDKAGTERDKALLAGHRARGGVIRLWPDDAVEVGLALAEGIETALSAAWLYTPIWSAIDAANLGDFPIVLGIHGLTVFADNDKAGLSAGHGVAQRWRDAGREVVMIVPLQSGADINDLVTAA